MNSNFLCSIQNQNFSQPPTYYRELLASFCSLQNDLQNLTQKNIQLQNKIRQKNDSIAVIQSKKQKINQNKTKLIDQDEFFNIFLSQQKKQQKKISQNFIQKDESNYKNKSQENIQDKALFTCEYRYCGKQYNSQISLNLHIKLKHNGGSKKQRQAYAKLILESQKKGETAPRIFIELPPNYLKNYKEKQVKKQKNQKDCKNKQSQYYNSSQSKERK